MFYKSAICTTANKLKARGYTLSQAFVIAWAMAKGQETKVNGTTFGNRQKAIERLAMYTPEQVHFALTRENDNQYDKNAVAVMVSVSGSAPYKIGYVPAVTAPLVAAILDNGTGIKAKLKAIVGGYSDGIGYGLRLNMSLAGGENA